MSSSKRGYQSSRRRKRNRSENFSDLLEKIEALVKRKRPSHRSRSSTRDRSHISRQEHYKRKASHDNDNSPTRGKHRYQSKMHHSTTGRSDSECDASHERQYSSCSSQSRPRSRDRNLRVIRSLSQSSTDDSVSSKRDKRSRYRSKSRKSPSITEETTQQKSISKDDKENSTENMPKIDPSILELLGEDPTKDDAVGPDILPEIAERWNKIFKVGLEKDARKELTKKYPASGNCTYMKAPLMNPEIKSTLNASATKSDYFQSLFQNQLGAAISAIGSALTELVNLKNKTTDKETSPSLISTIGNAGRIMVDLHHGISMARRYNIVPGLNPLVKMVAEECPVDSLLFG